MEDVLDLYEELYDPNRPVISFDETSKQLIANTRPSEPAKPGYPERYDYEYKRNGVCNLFMFSEPAVIELFKQYTPIIYMFKHTYKILQYTCVIESDLVREDQKSE